MKRTLMADREMQMIYGYDYWQLICIIFNQIVAKCSHSIETIDDTW